MKIISTDANLPPGITIAGEVAAPCGAQFAVAYAPDGTRFATGGADGSVRVWSADGELEMVLWGHSDYVLCVAWSPDGARLASASADKTVRLWDSAAGQALATLQGHSA